MFTLCPNHARAPYGTGFFDRRVAPSRRSLENPAQSPYHRRSVVRENGVPHEGSFKAIGAGKFKS